MLDGTVQEVSLQMFCSIVDITAKILGLFASFFIIIESVSYLLSLSSGHWT